MTKLGHLTALWIREPQCFPLVSKLTFIFRNYTSFPQHTRLSLSIFASPWKKKIAPQTMWEINQFSELLSLKYLIVSLKWQSLKGTQMLYHFNTDHWPSRRSLQQAYKSRRKLAWTYFWRCSPNQEFQGPTQFLSRHEWSNLQCVEVYRKAQNSNKGRFTAIV